MSLKTNNYQNKILKKKEKYLIKIEIKIIVMRNNLWNISKLMEYDIETMNCWKLTSMLFLDKPQFYDRSYRLRNDSHDRASELQHGKGRNDDNQWIGISHIQAISAC